jgi:hypothetical protein
MRREGGAVNKISPERKSRRVCPLHSNKLRMGSSGGHFGNYINIQIAYKARILLSTFETERINNYTL